MMKKILAVCAVLTVFAASASGINKIRWKEMNWRIYETENFEIYYYEGAGLLAEIAAVYAQEAFEKNSRIFNYRSEEKIPLFIYENKMDFTSTNITLSPLPEGAAGFTEAFKNRVVLPGSGSFRSLRELIAHEVAHAIQYNILYGEGMRSYNVLYKSYFIPMWIMEGQAEYCSGYNGSEGEMVLRDAVIKERLLPLDMLAGFSHLEEVYLAYKQSQSIFEYIEKKYGSKKVGPFIKYFSGEVSGPGIFKNILKISRENFEDQWMYFLKKKYWAQVQGRDNPEKYGPYLTKNVRSHIVHDVGAELSPDGKNIAFISSKAGLRDIYVMRHDGTGRKRILSGLEALETAGFPISWENDSAAIWFAAGDRGIKKLFRADINTGSVRKYAVKGIEQLNSPAVSPGGRFVAFTGVDGGFSNIYIFDIKSGETVNITNNVFENGSPNWSGDGKRIVFTEERNEYTRIAVLDLLSGEKEYLTEKGAYECRYPRFISGDSVIFTSDRNGIFNLYMLDINAKKEKQLTDVPNGIFYPSAGDDFFIYSYYEDACYNIYKHLRDPVQKTASAEKSSQMRPLRLEDIVPAQGGDDGFLDHIKTAAAEIIKDEKKYTIDFSPDIVFALVGIGTDMGITGGAYLTASDMLGNHNMGLVINAVPGYYSQYEFSYLYLALPFDLGISLYYNQNIYKIYDVETGEFFSRLNSSQFGGLVQMSYPLGLYSKVGLNLSSMKITDEYTNLETSNTYDFPGNDSDVVNTAAVYYSLDRAAWRDFWPYSGESVFLYAETSEKMFGGTKSYRLLEADVRKHFDLSMETGKNMSFSMRFLYAMTIGGDRPYFRFGGLNTVRGVGYGEYRGDKIAALNLEFRHTVSKNMDFELWPFNFFIIKNLKFFVFLDSGIVKSGDFETITNEEVKNGAGMGFVVDTFLLQKQYFPFKFEFAKRLDVPDTDWKFYFSINTGF